MKEGTVRKRKFWQLPWGYQESVVIVAGLLLVGIALDLISANGPALPVWPLNLALLGVVLFFLFFLYRFSLNTPALEFFFSVPASVGAIMLFSLLTLAIGLVPWEGEGMNTARMLGSWTYLIAHMYVLVTLGMTIIFRLHRYRRRSLAFLLNHIGLWVVLAAAGVGTADRSKLVMNVEEGQTVWYARDQEGRTVELPLAVRLNDFILEQYPPKLVVVETGTGAFADISGNNVLLEGPFPQTFAIGDRTVRVVECIEDGFFTDTALLPLKRAGASPYARVIVTEGNHELAAGWVTNGSQVQPSRWLRFSKGFGLVMLEPEPLKYLSKVTLYLKEGEVEDHDIEVNRPLKAAGWKIYQMSYNKQAGKYSRLSVFELVRDPWLPVVYAGFYLMIAGAIALFWQGKKRKDTGNGE